MRRRILIAGAGQLGSRYLQGMVNYGQALDIWVYDPSIASLERAKQRWGEVAPIHTQHTVKYVSAIDGLPESLDLVVVATTADARARVVAQLAKQTVVANWVLEKVLAQSHDELSRIQKAIGSAARAWVNTPMHMWSLYKELRKQYPGEVPIKANFKGFRGLTCNAIHYVDFVCRWNNTEVLSTDTTELQSSWYPSKREGFFEIDGVLQFSFTDGSVLRLASNRENLGYQAHIVIGDDEWQVFEADGYAQTASGKRIGGSIEFQSQLTAPMMESIFSKRSCELPTLAQSVGQHQHYLSVLLGHWNAHMPDQRSTLPIT